MPIKRSLNQNFFREWSNDMAYVLGFFAADGTMRITRRNTHFIEFHITDKQLLESIKATVGSSHKISQRVRKDGWKLGYRLQIGSKRWYLDLMQLRFTERKSKVMKLPSIPKEYFGCFVRGYFDGDGCVYFKEHPRSDRGTLTWVFSTRFTSGSRIFLTQLHNQLKLNGLTGGYIYEKEKGYELVFSRRDSLALYELMYNNTPHVLELPRKRAIFERAIKTLWS